MSGESAQGGEAAAAEMMLDDGFSADERAAFDAMMTGEPAPDPALEQPVEPIVDPTATGEQPDPALAAAEGDDDDEADGQQPAQQQNAQVDKDGKPLPRRVNYNKFARMEDRAKKAEGELAQLKEMFTRTDERLKLLNDALTAGQRKEVKEQRDEDPEPDPEKDIFGWVKWAQRDRQRMMQQLQGQQQSRQADQGEQQLKQFYRDDVQVFAQQEPNFAAAYDHLIRSRAVELAQYFFGKDITEGERLTPPELQRIRAAISSEERALVAEAAQNRQSPAKRVFMLAKARGFKPGVAAQPGAQGAQNGQGGQQQPAARQNAQAASAAPSVAEEIARIQRGTRQPSLSQGGGAPANPMTAERLANMPQEEFERMVEHMSDAQLQQFMGA
jgi:hypothetical protein